MRLHAYCSFFLVLALAIAPGRGAAQATDPAPNAADPTAAPAPAAEPAAEVTPPATAADVTPPAAAAEVTPPATAASPASPAQPGSTAAEKARAHEAVQAQIALVLARKQAAARRSRTPQHGDAGAPFAIGATLELPWYTDTSYDVFSKEDVGRRFGAWFAFDIAELRRDTILALEVGWETEHAEDNALRGGTLDSDLTTNALHAGAALRVVPVSWLQPHLRLVGGASFVAMKLTSSRDVQTEFKDRGVAPFGSVGLGFTLRTPTRWFEDDDGRLAWLSFGLMVEGGYTLTAPLDLKLDGPGPSARDITIVDASAGRLTRSGPYIRTSFVIRF